MESPVNHPSDDSFDLESDTLHEECGVFGILGHNDASTLTALGIWKGAA